MDKNCGFTFEEVYNAYQDCLKNKKNTLNAINFMQRALINVAKLQMEINNGTYEIGTSITFIVTYPKLREIFAADFRDRVVHHLIINEILPYLESYFIPETFSCRRNKGVFHGVDVMAQHIKECSHDYTKEAWILKMDVKAFFMSISKSKLSQMVDDFIIEHYPNNPKKEILRQLFKKVVLHHPEENCQRRGNLSLWDKLDEGKSLFKVDKDKGEPIGNLTSQVLANLFLTPLDKYIKNDLNFQYYGRYVDDFGIICEDKQRLLDARSKIVQFAKEKLGITIHPKKIYLQECSKGVNFIGCTIKQGRKYILNRTKGMLYQKIQRATQEGPTKQKAKELLPTINSYWGIMQHYNTYNILKDMFEKKRLLEPWNEFFKIESDFSKISLCCEKDKKPKCPFDCLSAIDLSD